MFSFLNKSSKQAEADKVWQSRSACLMGTVVEAQKALKSSQTPVVFYYFSETGSKFVEFLKSHSIAYSTIDSTVRPEPTRKCEMMIVVDAFTLGRNDIMQWLVKQSKASELKLLFLGHYPLIEPERNVLESLNQHIGLLPLMFCVSLEDPLLEHFGSDRIKPLMASLGMKEDESIEHNLVSKAILSARKKLGDRVKSEIKANSEADWFTKNVTLQL